MYEVFQPLRIFSAASGQDLLSLVERCIAAEIHQVVVNFEHVTFMDSAGLGVLVTAFKRLRMRGGDLCLCALNGQAQMLLDLTNMNQVFVVYPSLSAAKQALQAEG
jgi:anti-sigma B factor antagonist